MQITPNHLNADVSHFDDKLAKLRDLLCDTRGPSKSLVGLDEFARQLPRVPPEDWAAHGLQIARSSSQGWQDGDIGGISCGKGSSLSFRLRSATDQALARVEPDGLRSNQYTFVNPHNGLIYFADLNPVWETRRAEEAEIRVLDVPRELRLEGPLSDCEYGKVRELRVLQG